jgi:hypothetical protein
MDWTTRTRSLYLYASGNPIKRIDPSGAFDTDTPCCCCVDSLEFGEAAKVKKSGQGRLVFGHKFAISIGLLLGPAKKATPCKLEWWEWTDRLPPLEPPEHNEKWIDEYAYIIGKKYEGLGPDVVLGGTLHPWVSVFHPWCWDTRKCPEETSLSLKLKDEPMYAVLANETDKRRLFFRIRIRSGEGCKCKKDQLTLEGCQILAAERGTITEQDLFFGDEKRKCPRFPPFPPEQ